MSVATEIDVEQTPEYWLIVLLRALRGSDLALAAEAQQSLRELGIDIRFGELLRPRGKDAK
jgi:hypothetical protein